MFLLPLIVVVVTVHAAGNTWRNLGSSPTLVARHSLTAVTLKRQSSDAAGTVFVHGGRDDVFNFRDVRSRGASDATWSSGASNATVFRRDHCAVAINDATQMLVFGGYGSGSSSEAATAPLLGQLDVYTVSSNAWQTLPAGPSARARMSCVVHRQGSLIVFGGITAQGRSNELWRFDFGPRRWENLTPQMTGDVPLALSGHTATIVNGDTMLVFGGFRDASFELREVRLLDLTTLEWRLRVSPSAAQPLARESHAALPINNATQVVFFGGISNGAFLEDAWLLEPLSGVWVQLARPAGAPSRRGAVGATASLSGAVAFLVGGTDGLLKTDMFEYTPPSCSPACLNFGLCDGVRCVCDNTGFSGAQCQTPVCSPACQNGGQCVAPNTCSCATATRNGGAAYGRQCEGFCGDRVVQSPQEACDDGNSAAGDCCVACQPESFDTQCRAAAGACDVAERCEGRTACPADRFVNGTVCRAIAGPCDRAEQCDGTQAQCPSDAFVAAGVVCRAKDARNECDIADVCSGTAPACPPDRFQPIGTPCNNNDTCTAGTDTCSSAGVCVSGASTCNCNTPAECDDRNPCTVDSCTNRRCEHAAGNAGTSCRPKAGECDIAEVCDGVLPFCPRDRVEMFGTLCRASMGDCDLPELCDGRSAACGADAKLAGDVCRRSLGVCDVEERCNGVDNGCPPNALRSNTTVCRNGTSTCDPPEYCSGTATQCDVVNYFSPINSPCDDGDLCSSNDRCQRGGACVGDPVTPCARFDLPTPPPPPGATPQPTVIDEAQACYLLRDNCELCTQLAACGYCATHGGKAGACNPEAVQQQCIDIGGTWNVPCDSLSLPAPTPPVTPVPTRMRPSPTPTTSPAPISPRPSPETTTRPVQRVTVVEPFGTLTLPDVFRPSNSSDDGPLGLGWGTVSGVSLEWIFVGGLVVLLLIVCCGCGIFAIRVKRAREIGRGRR